MNSKKILSTVFVLALLTLSLTGCGFSSKQDSTIADAEGNMLKYDINTLYSKNLDGFFIKNKDKTFSPVMAGMDHYEDSGITGMLNKTDYQSRFIWFSDTPEIKLHKLIPKVSKKTPLVGFFNETSKMPDSYYLEKYIPMGYTIGWTFKMAEDQSSLLLDSKTSCTNSSASYYGETVGLDSEYEVKKFNESEELPINNIDTPTGLILGLEKGKPYQVGYYDGTVYYSTTREEFILKADTEVFKSGGVIDLGVPFNKTTDNYFEIILPDNLEPGYYYINDYGLFEYVGNN